MKKIFLIGFNKTATTSFHILFVKSGIKSIHWGGVDPKSNIACNIMKNISNGFPVLRGLEKYTAFSDMTFINEDFYIEGCKFFKYLYEEYPDSYFILNTRSLKNWIRSREHHMGGEFLRSSQKSLGLNKKETAKFWSKQYKNHLQEVRDFFKNNNANFIEFDIENNDIQNIVDFLKNDFKIRKQYWTKTMFNEYKSTDNDDIITKCQIKETLIRYIENIKLVVLDRI